MDDTAAGGDETRGERSVRPIDSVLLNALAEVTVEESTPVLDDETSRGVLEDTLTEVTTEAARRRFAEAIATPDNSEEDGSDDISVVVDAVRDALAARGVRVVVDHEASFSLDPEQVALYNFSRTRSPSALSSLEPPSQARGLVEEGAAMVAEEDYEAAAGIFADAVDEAGTGEGSVAVRTLAAWAQHWAKNDHAAIDFVEEALHLHMDAWSPKLVGHSADPDRSFARPQQFRDGKYAAMLVLRYTVDCPGGTDLTPALGLGSDDGEVAEWVDLEGTPECTPLPRLAPENTLRLRLAGDVPAFPAMHGYYVGLGVVDLEVMELREVYRLFLEGPVGDRVTETIRIIPEE